MLQDLAKTLNLYLIHFINIQPTFITLTDFILGDI